MGVVTKAHSTLRIDGHAILTGRRTAVLFIRHISTVIITITDPTIRDTATGVGTLELVVTACYTHTLKKFVMSDSIHKALLRNKYGKRLQSSEI